MTNKLLDEYVEKHEKIAREEGKLEGTNEERNKWITVLIENNVPYEEIARYAGLSIEEIKKAVSCQQLI